MTATFAVRSSHAAMPANRNAPSAVDPAKLEAFVGKMLGDLGGAFTAPLVHLGDKLGLYRDLAKNGSATSLELAQRTGLAERYVREWLANQAASGYVAYDPPTRSYALLPEQAMVFADEESPVFPEGAFDGATSVAESLPRHEAAFRSGEGIAWGDHSACLFCAVERFFRPVYRSHLIGEWLPALDGVVERLKNGGRVADVGCGHGASTVMIAEAFPEAEVVGFDSHAPSIEHAQDLARRKGLDNLRFEVADAQSYRGQYDLIAFFDSLHDMGDPVGAAAHAKSRLAPGGTWMLVEPFAEDRLEDNFTPMGRLSYAASTLACVPGARAQEGGLALGAQAGPARLMGVIRQGGFARARVAARTPFNLVIEATA
jgi:2-polyprenyl-3-methyl-5-hydroxy-6-metoxy-1,4-benzoquinol methylase